MKRYLITSTITLLITLLVLTNIAYSRPLAVNPASATITTGQTMSIEIDTPTAGTTVSVPPTNISVTGRAVIGDLNAKTNIVYIVDVSGSTTGNFKQDCDGNGTVDELDNFANDFFTGSILDCEVSGILALNQSLLSQVNNGQVNIGLVLFGSRAAIADISPDSGQQNFTPLNADGATHLDTIARTLAKGSIGLYLPKLVSSATNFYAALTVVNDAFETQPAEVKNIAFFLSDGYGGNNIYREALQATKNAGITVYTFSIGFGGAGCDEDEELGIIAKETGGECTEVPDPSNLSAILPSLDSSEVNRVEVRLNGNDPVVVTPNSLGYWSADLSGLVCGPNLIEATAVANDGTQATANITIQGNCGTGIPSSLTIINTANPAIDHAFIFVGDLGEFSLSHDQAKTFTDLSPGSYTIGEDQTSFPDEYWGLLSVSCEGNEIAEVIDDNQAEAIISVQDGETVTCTFYNERVNFFDSTVDIYLPFMVKP